MTSTDLPPYARALGMTIAGHADGSPIVTMPWSDRVMGRPGFMHGGAIGGVLEMAGFAAIMAELERQGTVMRVRPINISTEYLRGGQPEPIYAAGQVVRAGRRVANVRIEAWQGDRTRPVASCWMNFQLSPPKG